MEYSRTYIAIPPGETIKEILEDRKISQIEFATRMELSQKHISQLLNGKVELTPETAVKLEFVLGMPAKFWSNLEAGYRTDLIKVKEENALDEERKFVDRLGYAALSKLGWVPKTKNYVEKVFNLRYFFEVTSLSLIETKKFTDNVVFRKLRSTDKSELLALAWCQKARIEARKQELEKLNIGKLKSKLETLKQIASRIKPDLQAMQTILNECGIAMVILPQLQGSGINGASFAIGKNAVLGLTDRRKTTDVFCFSFFHELAHVINGDFHRCESLTQADELKADKFASELLISPSDYLAFVQKGDFSKKAILNFADQESVDAGIVGGRLQKERKITCGSYNSLKHNFAF